MNSSHRPGTRHPIRTALLLAGSTTLAAGLLVLPTALPAQAYIPDAPPCIGASCVGHSPYAANHEGWTCVSGEPGGNDGAKTIASVDDAADGEIVYLRWSAYCQANWATISDPGQDSEDTAPSWYVQTYDKNKGFPLGGQYTSMVDGTQLAHACEIPYAETTPGCTGWN